MQASRDFLSLPALVINVDRFLIVNVGSLQFQGDHKESLYWGTYRPNVYVGMRAGCFTLVISCSL